MPAQNTQAAQTAPTLLGLPHRLAIGVHLFALCVGQPATAETLAHGVGSAPVISVEPAQQATRVDLDARVPRDERWINAAS